MNASGRLILLHYGVSQTALSIFVLEVGGITSQVTSSDFNGKETNKQASQYSLQATSPQVLVTLFS